MSMEVDIFPEWWMENRSAIVTVASTGHFLAVTMKSHATPGEHCQLDLFDLLFHWELNIG